VNLGAGELRDLLDSLESGVGLLDEAGRVVYANRALLRLADGADVEGRPFAEAFPRLRGDIDWEQAAARAVGRGRIVRLSRHDVGSSRQVNCSLRPAAIEGMSALALLTVRDVTDAVRMEARLLRQARTQAIANFGDSVAHEIRNPLNSLHMNVQLLREWLDADPPNRADLDRTASTVQREIKRLDRVVRDFVQYSRPPALRLEPGSANHVVRAALDMLDAEIRGKRIEVGIDLQSARPVTMDRDRLQRAVYNVLLNAVQVLPEEGHITCRSRDEGSRCLLEISDNGPGLEPGRAEHIFDLFYTTKPGGTGLGLPLANRIVEEHGGSMAVASEPGSGATFAMFLPFDGPPAARAGGPTAVPRMPEETDESEENGE
jgi:PAS domain S-box-containing protein